MLKSSQTTGFRIFRANIFSRAQRKKRPFLERRAEKNWPFLEPATREIGGDGGGGEGDGGGGGGLRLATVMAAAVMAAVVARTDARWQVLVGYALDVLSQSSGPPVCEVARPSLGLEGRD